MTANYEEHGFEVRAKNCRKPARAARFGLSIQKLLKRGNAI